MYNKLLFFILTFVGFSQEPIFGFVYDKETSEPISEVSLFSNTGDYCGKTNRFGYFNISAQSPWLVLSHVSYQEDTVKVSRGRSNRIYLTERMYQSEALVTEDRDLSLKTVHYDHLTVKEIKDFPTMAGELDLLKAIQMRSGVSGSSDLTNHFSVRGGLPDQNLILLDNIPIYNPSHLFGFYSIFNPTAVQDMTLYKSYLPSEFSGRLSSVLQVHLKEGNKKEFKFSGGLTLLSSQLTLEGPIIANKSSFIFSARRSYLDLAIPSPDSKAEQETLNQSILHFYDFILKANYETDFFGKISLSAYHGVDRLNLTDIGGRSLVDLDWANKAYQLAFEKVMGPRLFWNSYLIYGSYRADFLDGESSLEKREKPSIDDLSFKSVFYYKINETLNSQLGLLLSQKSLGYTKTLLFESFTKSFPDLKSAQVFGDFEYNYSDRFKFKLGATAAYYQNLDEFYVEPKISLSYLSERNNLFTFDYQHLYQYLHGLSGVLSENPIQMYYPSTKDYLPESSHQFSLNFKRAFQLSSGNYTLSASAYHKTSKGLTTDDDFAREFKLLQGEMTSYGLEILLDRQAEKFAGWISFDYNFTEYYLNHSFKNKYFSPRFYKPFQFKLYTSYKIAKNWGLGGFLHLSSGELLTAPANIYLQHEKTYADGSTSTSSFAEYESVNNSRLQMKRRLDLNLNYHFKSWSYDSKLTLSLYNVLFSHDPLFMTTSSHTNSYGYVYLSFIPSIGYSISN